jgi:YHS domain-containing protein
MQICTIDPISGNDVKDLNSAPFVIEGRGKHAMKIYFESEKNKVEYQGYDPGQAGDDWNLDVEFPRSSGSGRLR